MTTYFETFTQYDNKYKDLVKLGFNKSACSTFAILTAYNFMENPDKTLQETYTFSGITSTKTITFNPDGSISEVIS